MKRISLLSILFLAFTAITFTSCGDTEPVDPVLTPGDGSGETPGAAVFKVDFSGNTYVATSTIATVGNGRITLGGIKGTNGQMVSIIVDGAAVGTYDGDETLMDYNPGNSEYSYSNLFVTGDDAGSVTITTINTTSKTISGTFHFVGAWSNSDANMPSVAFTNGSFENIPYTVETGGTNPDPDPVDGDDSFSAKINGTLQDYSADMNVAVSGVDATKTISIYGSANDTSLAITVYSNLTPGTYSFGSGFGDISGSYMDADGNGYSINSGSVTIQSNTGGWIKGTFTCVATNDAGETVYTITDGAFNVEWDF